MTATYDLSSGFTDLTRVRFHVGDTDMTAPIFDDAEINAVITEAGTWKRAVIALLESLIARLAGTPNFQADWLRVDTGSAIKAFEALIVRKRRELGVASITGGLTYQYRPDSDQTAAPEWDE